MVRGLFRFCPGDIRQGEFNETGKVSLVVSPNVIQPLPRPRRDVGFGCVRITEPADARRAEFRVLDVIPRLRTVRNEDDAAAAEQGLLHEDGRAVEGVERACLAENLAEFLTLGVGSGNLKRFVWIDEAGAIARFARVVAGQGAAFGRYAIVEEERFVDCRQVEFADNGGLNGGTEGVRIGEDLLGRGISLVAAEYARLVETPADDTRRLERIAADDFGIDGNESAANESLCLPTDDDGRDESLCRRIGVAGHHGTNAALVEVVAESMKTVDASRAARIRLAPDDIAVCRGFRSKEPGEHICRLLGEVIRMADAVVEVSDATGDGIQGIEAESPEEEQRRMDKRKPPHAMKVADGLGKAANPVRADQTEKRPDAG